MGSRSSVLSIRTAATSAVVLATAVALWIVGPGAAEFLSDEIPRVYDAVRAWLTPPYLYFIINGIIISIAASSRFQKAAANAPVPDTAAVASAEYGEADSRQEISVTAAEYEALPDSAALPVVTGTAAVRPAEYGEVDSRPEISVTAAEYETLPDSVALPVVTGTAAVSPAEYGEVDSRPEISVTAAEYETLPDSVALPVVIGTAVEAEVGDEKEEEELVITRSSWSPKMRESQEIPTEYSSVGPEKPLVSARLGQQRRSSKPSSDGKALGVTRTKRGETLESTWKAITDGRAVPLTRHLKKSDSWVDAHGSGRHEEHAVMMKSETFNERGRLRREPSVGQEELNRRVEAFINKFNEEMRLQRQESYQHYLDMINHGGHYH